MEKSESIWGMKGTSERGRLAKDTISVSHKNPKEWRCILGESEDKMED